MDESAVRFPCNLCPPGTDAHDVGLTNARALGSHLRAKHGIAGQSRASQYRHRAARRDESAEDRILGSHEDLETRIAGSDVEDYIGLVRDMSKELNRLWSLENQFHRVIEQSSLFRAALEEVQQDERVRKLRRPQSVQDVSLPQSVPTEPNPLLP